MTDVLIHTETLHEIYLSKAKYQYTIHLTYQYRALV